MEDSAPDAPDAPQALRDQVILGASLRALRERAGLTQEQFGARFGMDATYLSQLENGHHRSDQPELRLRIVSSRPDQCRSRSRCADERVAEFGQQPSVESQPGLAGHALGSGNRSLDAGARLGAQSGEAQGLFRQ